MRNFVGTIKWLPATVEGILGPCTYRVRLADGRNWRGHIDHIKVRYSSKFQEEKEKNVEVEELLPISPVCPGGPQLVPSYKSQIELEQCVKSGMADRIEQPTKTATEVPKTLDTAQLRRSSRTITKPDRLDYKTF